MHPAANEIVTLDTLINLSLDSLKKTMIHFNIYTYVILHPSKFQAEVRVFKFHDLQRVQFYSSIHYSTSNNHIPFSK